MDVATQVVEFWKDAGPDKWFVRDDAFDARFRELFQDEHHAAAARGREHWLSTAEGALALMLLLDQFPRNCFRGTAHSYATDGLARHYAMRAIEEGLDLQLVPKLRAFIYLPFEHSEDPLDQDRSVAMFDVLGDKEYLGYAELHREIIRRFGRFPHRNAVLGRIPTPEELDYLAEGGFAG
ncbi:DUF924 family protein [Stenotrophomonas sp. 24(2023)]|uniref:DUF924 family protein n=1 Tax=Stenotrophomonas sp. 24(2023) TaxID=3068324 RepID=UPI0027E12312|nr:DUF924 family protein [Stenotrophomonas sp. 24(2023)]WMJ70459.1 DUF924 family protein [Stenotrophomonas sp. 24(2023)]